jgi:ribosomal-protein-alanine N-acetyltransferase
VVTLKRSANRWCVATIETARLLLRGWRDSDVEPWVQMNADPRVTEFFPRIYTRELSESTAQRLGADLESRGYGWWVVDVREGRAFAGVVALQEVPFPAHFTPAREIGWRFAPECWGFGYATEAARVALGFAFNRLGWHEVVAMTAVPNLRSQRVMERLGMTRVAGGDFDHPRIEEGHPLRRHVLYRIGAPEQASGNPNPKADPSDRSST